MKTLVCGKGGAGKSTVVALLAKEIAGRKHKVLIIDSDESNVGLHSRLGMQKPEDFMNYFGGKKVLFAKTKDLKDRWRLDDLPGEYVTERGNIRLLSMGKIYQFGEGCACPINALSSTFLEILDLGDGEFLIADTDAGIEHFGRGVEKGIDILLVVIDPSRESILMAEKVTELGREADKPVHYILNRINGPETEEFILNAIDREKVIAIISETKELFMAGLAGNEFTADVKGISEIADLLESEKKTRLEPE
jgi:CO dehydrogenase maturation factor